MKCPFCTTLDTKVIDSRINQPGDMIRRRRECPRCEGRFTTYERVEEIMPAVIKKDGRREPYERQKVLDGLNKACQKRSVPVQKIEELVQLIEKRIQSYGLKEISTRTVGQMIMVELHKLDKSRIFDSLLSIASSEMSKSLSQNFKGQHQQHNKILKVLLSLCR